jgi:hypothetical protein
VLRVDWKVLQMSLDDLHLHALVAVSAANACKHLIVFNAALINMAADGACGQWLRWLSVARLRRHVVLNERRLAHVAQHAACIQNLKLARACRCHELSPGCCSAAQIVKARSISGCSFISTSQARRFIAPVKLHM